MVDHYLFRRTFGALTAPMLHGVRRQVVYGVLGVVALVALTARLLSIPLPIQAFLMVVGVFFYLTAFRAIADRDGPAFNPVPVDSLDEALAEIGRIPYSMFDPDYDDGSLVLREIVLPRTVAIP